MLRIISAILRLLAGFTRWDSREHCVALNAGVVAVVRSGLRVYAREVNVFQRRALVEAGADVSGMPLFEVPYPRQNTNIFDVYYRAIWAAYDEHKKGGDSAAAFRERVERTVRLDVQAVERNVNHSLQRWLVDNGRAVDGVFVSDMGEHGAEVVVSGSFDEQSGAAADGSGKRQGKGRESTFTNGKFEFRLDDVFRQEQANADFEFAKYLEFVRGQVDSGEVTAEQASELVAEQRRKIRDKVFKRLLYGNKAVLKEGYRKQLSNGKHIVYGWRRVIRPELSQSGSCDLCVTITTRVYPHDFLSEVHDNCKCIVLPVTAVSDVGARMNIEDLVRLSRDISSKVTDSGTLTWNIAPKRVPHSELGDMLDHYARRARQRNKRRLLAGQIKPYAPPEREAAYNRQIDELIAARDLLLVDRKSNKYALAHIDKMLRELRVVN